MNPVVSFNSLGAHGRVGNQLWQIASTIGIALRNGGEASFPYWDCQGAFKNELPNNLQYKDVPRYNEVWFDFRDVVLNNDIDLFGYFQSVKYWEGNEDVIKKQFEFKETFVEDAKEYLKTAFHKETISIHIRRGDYINCPHYVQLPITWFIGALISIENWQDKNIIIFSDDIPYCKVHFLCLKNVWFSENKSEFQDLALMSQCDNHILSNSTFSWWGAYLSKQKNVIYPCEYFRGEKLGNNDMSTFWPESWHSFGPVIYKLDIKDCTFTIPVFADHKDRIQNLNLCVCVLQSNFNTNIIIGEQGSSKFKYFEQWCKYIKFDLSYFHRTKMLNDMAKASETPYIANWDCDVIITPLQIYLTALSLRGSKEMVFPYDGRFARLPRGDWFKKIEKTIDIGVIGDLDIKGKNGRKVPETSVGGAVFWNKQAFIEAGMENEHMISFGPEDCERNDRTETLGLKKDRVKGPLYHIDHWCGTDSSTLNPYFRANHVELEKIRKMNKEDLKAYIQTWSWVPNKELVAVQQAYKRLSELTPDFQIKVSKEAYGSA